MKKVFNIIQNIEIALAVLIIILFFVVRVFGYTPYVVESGSMEPTIPTYSIAYVKNVDANDINKKDVIAFNIDKKVVTHRVIYVNKNENCFVTKGDANKAKDPSPVKFENCVGKVSFHIEYLGQGILFLQTLKGKIVLGGIIVINIIIGCVINQKQKMNNLKGK